MGLQLNRCVLQPNRSPPSSSSARLIAQKDGQALRRAAHKVKSSVGPFSAPAADEAACHLELVGEQGHLSQAETAFNRLEQALTLPFESQELQDADLLLLQKDPRRPKLLAAN